MPLGGFLHAERSGAGRYPGCGDTDFETLVNTVQQTLVQSPLALIQHTPGKGLTVSGRTGYGHMGRHSLGDTFAAVPRPPVSCRRDPPFPYRR